jgi:uncharacterized SAM-binding protein YcdF (DUF218 family)
VSRVDVEEVLSSEAGEGGGPGPRREGGGPGPRREGDGPGPRREGGGSGPRREGDGPGPRREGGGPARQGEGDGLTRQGEGGRGAVARRLVLRIGVALIASALVLVGGTAASIYRYGRIDDAEKADAASVLGAAAWGRRPSPVLRERLNHAILLYRQGYVPRLLFTGGQAKKSDPAESEVSRRYAIQQGVPAADILIEARSRSTEENLFYAREVARAHRLSTFLLVSDPLHMKRAMAIARDLGMDAHSSPTATSRFQSFGSQLPFLARETYFLLRYRLRHV